MGIGAQAVRGCGGARSRVLVAVLVAALGCDTGEPDPFPPSSAYAGVCATPRTGVDPWGDAYPDRLGTMGDEKTWVRSWIDELYLWYAEVQDFDPAAYATAADYFDVLKTPALTASGRPKDQFHFWWPTAAWEALAVSGVEAGYGVQWVVLSGTPPRKVVAAYVEPASPASDAGIARGVEVIAVDDVDIDVASNAGVDALNAGLFPWAPGETHVLRLRGPGAEWAVTLTSEEVQLSPVPEVSPISTSTGVVGYLLFNDHVATAELALANAFQQLRTAGVTDLVLDLRYNGGGYLDIASEVAFMIAGPARTAGKTFERLVFNDKHRTVNPVTGQPLTPVPFFDVTLGFSAAEGQPLPTLNLGRVFVLTGSGTCSASESIINSLRGIGVQVIQIGAQTCGKPYGFYPADDCGTTYFAVQFQGVNHAGFGDYADGFAPGGSGPAGVPGCVVADDFGHALGDRAEARLAAALARRQYGTCFAASVARGLSVEAELRDGEVVKSPPRRSRIMVR